MTGPLATVWPELGEIPEIHELPPVTEAVKASGTAPVFDTNKSFTRFPGAAERAVKLSVEGVTLSFWAVLVTFRVTATTLARLLLSRTRTRAGYDPAARVPWFTLTTNPAGAVPLVGLTLSQEGAGVLLCPPSTRTLKVTGGVAPGPGTIPI